MSRYYHTYKVKYLECMDCEPRSEPREVFNTHPGKLWISFRERRLSYDGDGSTWSSKLLGINIGDSVTWVCQHGQFCRAYIQDKVRWEGPFSRHKEREAMKALGWKQDDK